jgi:hypothetical protein
VRDEAAAQERASRGARYAELLRSGEITDALDGIEADYTRGMTDCHDRDERDRLWLAVQVVRKVKAQLQQIASDGRLAEGQLQQIRKLRL